MCCFNDNKQSYFDYKNYGSFYNCGYGYSQNGNGKCPYCNDKRDDKKERCDDRKEWDNCHNQNGWGNCSRPCPEHKPCWQNPCDKPHRPDNKEDFVRVKFEGYIKFC
ncbi:MAG: hypothetical protein IJ301_05465 [Clostridia bacterium]|nr:hypothetical protein [Clostridia bacterium]